MSDPKAPRGRPGERASLPMTAAELAGWDEILDARSPAEFAEDHLPGAVSCPVLDDEERAVVGTVYKERGAFEAKRIGAPLVAANISRLVSTRFADRPRRWRPLVYCWRGGTRSGSLAHVLRQVGWEAAQLEGGYKAFRRQVVADLDTMPAAFAFTVVCGATGSGKSRLLEALAREGAQVLDLEALAAHRGSLLGELPGAPQPSQKAFERRIWSVLSGLDASRPVFVESESRKVGDLRVPEALILRMRASECLRLEAPQALRARLLREDYSHFEADPDRLAQKLSCLAPLHGRERIAGWLALLGRGDWDALVAELLEAHYDPAYQRSLSRNYPAAAQGPPVAVQDVSEAAFRALAARLAQAAVRGGPLSGSS